MKKYVNGQLLDMNADEIKVRQAQEKEWSDGQAARNIADLRIERDKLLAKTDHLALSDQTLSAEMKTYRQALRDITKTYSSMNDNGFAWPTKP